jgi:hypothetical protein
MNEYIFPPWRSGPDEKFSSDLGSFKLCLRAIDALSSRMKGRITDQTCSRSEQWGRVVRAQVAYEREGTLGAALVTCWSVSGSSVEIAVSLDCCSDPPRAVSAAATST